MVTNAVIYSMLTVMAVWAHLKTMLTEPGVVPRGALPIREDEAGGAAGNHTLCGRCDAYKPVRYVALRFLCQNTNKLCCSRLVVLCLKSATLLLVAEHLQNPPQLV